MRRFLGGLAAVAFVLTLAVPTLATQSEKVYVCHAAGRADEPANWVTLHVPATSTGYPQGHFTENGTQEAGHEQDYLGQCKEPQPSATPPISPEPSLSPTPSPSTTPAPSATPEVTSPPSPEPSTSPSPEPTRTPTPSVSPSPTSTPTQVPYTPIPTPPDTSTE